MELGDAMERSSGEATVAVTAHDGAEEHDHDDDDEKMMNNNINGGGGGGGNRWPRQETLALLKIRSDMDGVFRDSSLKGPLWEQVSRKLAAMGYQRSAKKCKEKFENVYKYHKRTKESRSGKSEGKSYRFFDQLQALENQFTHSYPPKPQPCSNIITTTIINTTLAQPQPLSTPSISSYLTTTSTTVPSINPTTTLHNFPSPPPPPNNGTVNPKNPSDNNNNNVSHPLPNMNNLFTTTTTSTSSSTASDEDLEEKYRKKRKWKDYFRRLTKQVLAKQEEMQKKFLEAIDKREREQVAQQDAWRFQEMARINREHDLLVQERSSAAAKNAAVIAFLQKLSGSSQQNIPTPPPPPQPQEQPPPPPPPASQVQRQQQQQVIPVPLPQKQNNINVEIQKINNGHSHTNSTSPLSSSRWPKPEIHALIRLRTSLEPKYQENGPKAPLWEDISAGMQRLGYNRNAKRCKEKWENINKYYKKMKESNKQRREDSKTCPYFDELDALYKEKSKTQNPFGGGSSFDYNMMTKQNNEMMMEPLMVQPEQQWRPPPPPSAQSEKDQGVEEGNKKTEEEDEDNDEYDEEGDYSMEEEEEGCYEVPTNKLCSVDTVE